MRKNNFCFEYCVVSVTVDIEITIMITYHTKIIQSSLSAFKSPLLD